MAGTKEDPYFVVRDDVNDSLEKVEALLQKYHDRKSLTSDTELVDILKDLRNSIRSIEWDLEDLQETVNIVEKTPSRFNLTQADVAERHYFISQVKQKLSTYKKELEGTAKSQNGKPSEKQSLLGAAAQSNSYSSSKAQDSNRQFFDDTLQQQQLLIQAQDEQIDNIGASVKVLKNMSTKIGTELEDQSLLLDEFGHEMENTGTKMDATMKKIAKVTRLSNDKKQCWAIVVLVVIAIVLVILICVL